MHELKNNKKKSCSNWEKMLLRRRTFRIGIHMCAFFNFCLSNIVHIFSLSPSSAHTHTTCNTRMYNTLYAHIYVRNNIHPQKKKTEERNVQRTMHWCTVSVVPRKMIGKSIESDERWEWIGGAKRILFFYRSIAPSHFCCATRFRFFFFVFVFILHILVSVWLLFQFHVPARHIHTHIHITSIYPSMGMADGFAVAVVATTSTSSRPYSSKNKK